MARARSSRWVAAALGAVASLVAAGGTAAAVHEIEKMPGFGQLASAAAAGTVESREHERQVLRMIQRGQDAQALDYLEALGARDAALAARLHESLAGAYVRDRRLYRATQHLDAIPPARRSDQAWYLVGHVAARQQRLQPALDAFGRLASRLPDDPLVARDEAQIASLLGQPGRAAAACERLLRRQPGDVEATLLLARMRVQQGRLEEAALLLSDATSRKPRHGRAALQLGLVRLALDDPGAARQSLLRARSLEPQSSPPHVAAAAVELLAGDPVAARAAAGAGLKANPADPLAALVVLLAADGRWPASRPGDARHSAASLHPDLDTEPLAAAVSAELATPAGRARLAVAHVLAGLLAPQAALHWLDDSGATSPGPLTELVTARAEMDAGRRTAARKRLEALSGSEAGRGLVGPASELATLAVARNDPAAAQAALERALEVAPQSPRVRMLAGDLHLALGQPERAVPEYRAALVHWSRDPRLLNQLAYALAQTGTPAQREEALRLAETGLAQQPHYLLRAALLDTRADLLFRLGRAPEALAAYRALSTTVGGMTSPEQWHRLGDLAHAAGEGPLARRAYEEALDYGRDYRGRSVAIARVEPSSPRLRK